MERRYAKSIRRLDKQETRLRKSYSKRIDRAEDAMRQKKLRGDRDDVHVNVGVCGTYSR